MFNVLRTGVTFDRTTTNTMLTVNLEHGEKYEIEIIAVFEQLNSSAVSATTVIGNIICHGSVYCMMINESNL